MTQSHPVPTSSNWSNRLVTGMSWLIVFQFEATTLYLQDEHTVTYDPQQAMRFRDINLANDEADHWRKSKGKFSNPSVQIDAPLYMEGSRQRYFIPA